MQPGLGEVVGDHLRCRERARSSPTAARPSAPSPPAFFATQPGRRAAPLGLRGVGARGDGGNHHRRRGRQLVAGLALLDLHHRTSWRASGRRPCTFSISVCSRLRRRSPWRRRSTATRSCGRRRPGQRRAPPCRDVQLERVRELRLRARRWSLKDAPGLLGSTPRPAPRDSGDRPVKRQVVAASPSSMGKKPHGRAVLRAPCWPPWRGRSSAMRADAGAVELDELARPRPSCAAFG